MKEKCFYSKKISQHCKINEYNDDLFQWIILWIEKSQFYMKEYLADEVG